MPKLLRALLISAVATGAAAIVLKLIRPEPPFPPPKRPTGPPYVDADRMTDAQRELLMQELDAQL